MPWMRPQFVDVGQGVTVAYMTQFLENLLEDDVAKVTAKGDLVVGSSDRTRPCERLGISPEGYVLRSRADATPQWVAPTSLGAGFVTGQEFKLFIQS